MISKENLTAWALANGWTMIAGMPSLTKPSAPKEPIVRLKLLATVAQVEVKKPAGKWEKWSSAAYAALTQDPESLLPHGLGFENIPSFTTLMQENKDRQVFLNMK